MRSSMVERLVVVQKTGVRFPSYTPRSCRVAVISFASHAKEHGFESHQDHRNIFIRKEYNMGKLDNIVIVGGGTAGWITALLAKKRLPKANVTLIESEEIGILGAGEGTTPHINTFLSHVDIPFTRLVREAGATIKNGIKFTNWTGDGSSYYHELNPLPEINVVNSSSLTVLPETSFMAVAAVGKGIVLDTLSTYSELGNRNKAAFVRAPNAKEKEDPMWGYENLGSYAIQFNAVELANLFKNIATKERGIKRIEGKVVDQEQKANGDIYELKLESGETVKVDFLFDCTGFGRRFIGKVYGSEYKRYEKLTVDSAAPFFLPIDENAIPSYTDAIAMKYGWMWKIPLQTRFGCGYVFDSSFITAEEAIAEVEEMLGHPVESPRTMRFEAGIFKQIWSHNCIAIGLSSGFIEPLEATSIWFSLMVLGMAFSDIQQLQNRNQKNINLFNKEAVEISDNIANLIYFHYMSGRKDTEFWRQFNDFSKAPEYLKDMLERWKYRLPLWDDNIHNPIKTASWVQVAEGLGLLNTKLYAKTYQAYNEDGFMDEMLESLQGARQYCLDAATDHAEMLYNIRKGF